MSESGRVNSPVHCTTRNYGATGSSQRTAGHLRGHKPTKWRPPGRGALIGQLGIFVGVPERIRLLIGRLDRQGNNKELRAQRSKIVSEDETTVLSGRRPVRVQTGSSPGPDRVQTGSRPGPGLQPGYHDSAHIKANTGWIQVQFLKLYK